MRNFWDFAWSYPAPDDFVRFDVDAASYTGAARANRAYYDSLRERGINVLGIMETTSTRSQEGYNAGAYDVDFARRRWREVGFPDSAPMAYAVSDGSRWDPNYGGDNIAGYGEGVGDHEVGPYKFYGNRYAVDHACAGARRSLHPELCLNLNGGWIPRTWDFDPNRDTAAQEIGGTPIGGIDVNTTYKPIFGPALPPAPTPTEDEKESAVKQVDFIGNGNVGHIWSHNGAVLYRAFVGGAPGGVVIVPSEIGSYTVAAGDPEGLVVPASIYGSAQVFFPSADGKEVVVHATAFGPVARTV